jgi:hypothetical protein
MNGALYVAWRAGDSTNGRWGPVGRLEHDAGGYRFIYTRGARTLEGFRAFPGMSELETIYESEDLFPLFANRLLAKSRPEYDEFLTWGGFDPNNPPDPIAILGVTEGMRQTDSLEVFPSPTRDADGCYVSKFFLHGVRWFEPAQERIAKLEPGENLGLMLDLSNQHDPNAVAVRTCDPHDRYMIGYVPRYLARDVHELYRGCGSNPIELRVERVNGDAPLQQRVLCRMSACWPDDFQPCGGEEFHPITDFVRSSRP